MENQSAFLFERVFVETPVDADQDGMRDLVAVFIRRPASTLDGEKVPAVYVANPYLMTCNEDWYDLHPVDEDLTVYPQQNLPEPSKEAVRVSSPAGASRETRGFSDTSPFTEEVEFECISELNDHLNERGYASVFCGGLGTRFSDGVTLTGSQEEILVFRSVINWLCGRCRAFTNKTDNIEIRADWCTGKVAMSGKSYLGTLCIGVAATGVEGLETIIPEAGISNWYDYFRCNGLTVPALGWQGDDADLLARYCFSRRKDPEDYEIIRERFEEHQKELIEREDRKSGNYNSFWEEGNYLHRLDSMKASAFIIQGLNDWNVKPKQATALFQALEARNIPRKMLLHQGEHVFIYQLKDSGTLEQIDRWLDHYLKGIDNGIEAEARVRVESNLDQSEWALSESWPPENGIVREFPINCSAYPEELSFVDQLDATVYRREEDNLTDWRDQLVLSEDPAYQNRLRFLWDPFPEEQQELRISGTVKVCFRAALDQPTAILSAMLVDLGEDRRITAEQKENADHSFTFALEETPSPYKVITRGWMNAQNRSCNYSKETIREGKFYDYELELVPMDYRVKAGHRLGLILYGTDAEATPRPYLTTTVRVLTGSIQAFIPIC
ncbi:MAG: Xaa-Pro dipeptidyl-peptidase [Lachnospiraceae bacterium]|nr:Xaa-Pro dipeptidyl-peptidase [Lachnospiraceae bacterium]